MHFHVFFSVLRMKNLRKIHKYLFFYLAFIVLLEIDLIFIASIDVNCENLKNEFEFQ